LQALGKGRKKAPGTPPQDPPTEAPGQ